MRRVLVVLLGLGLATAGGSASEPPALVTDHEFDGYLWGDRIICVHPVVVDDHARPCERSAAEHAHVPPSVAQLGGEVG